MKKRYVYSLMVMLLITMCFTGCGNGETDEKVEVSDSQAVAENVNNTEEAAGKITEEVTEEATNDYYLNEQGFLVDKVEEFKTQKYGEYSLKYPVLNEGVDEVVVYEFDTNDNIHVVLDASNVFQQVALDQPGDYGDVRLETVASDKDVVYMYDGERYYIEDSAKNLLTISEPISVN